VVYYKWLRYEAYSGEAARHCWVWGLWQHILVHWLKDLCPQGHSLTSQPSPHSKVLPHASSAIPWPRPEIHRKVEQNWILLFLLQVYCPKQQHY
jgi:hypothetical protein